MKKTTFLHLFLSGAALGLLFVPTSAHSAAGDLYVAQASGGGTIYKFTPAGTKSTFASGLFQPVALAFDRQGNLFVGDSGSCVCPPEQVCDCPPGTIYRFTPSGEKTTFATLASSQLLGMAFDGSGNLFVSDGLAILKFTPAGTQSTFAYPVDGVWPLAFDKLGNLYAGVNPIGPSSVLKFAPDGSSSTFISFPGPSFSSTTGLAFDSGGDLFVEGGDSILKVTSAGSTTTFATGNFTYPLAFDRGGNLFAGLFAFNSSEPAIVRFTPAGTKTTFAFAPPSFPTALAFEPVTEKLRNISARGLVGTGDNVLIGGFIVGGNAVATNAVVVRAIGPSLSSAGITNPLADPTLELHNASGALIASNNDWQDTQKAQIMASGLAPTDPRESAIFATLPAGAYTAIVRGVSDTTGVALVEIYNLSN